jgi:hypothetical protein
MQRLAAMEKLMLASPDQQISLTDPDSRSMATSGLQSFVGKCTQGRRRRWPVDMTSDRDTTGSLKSSRRLKEVGVYAIPSQRIQTGRPGDLRTG